MHAVSTEVDRRWVEPQQDLRSALIEIPDLIDLVVDLERSSEERYERARRIGDLHSHALVPGMAVEIAAHELAIVRPLVKRIGCAMRAEKTAPGPDEVEERRLLRVAHRQLAGGVEHHSRVTGELLGRELSHVLRHGDVEQPGTSSKLSQDRLRQRDSVVPIAGRVGAIEDAVLLRARGKRPRDRAAKEGNRRAAINGACHLTSTEDAER